MDSVQEQKLVAFLDGLGFNGQDFTAALQKQMQKGTPRFSQDYVQDFGEDRVNFRLYFQREPQLDAYRLEKYDARLRQYPAIAHTVINGMDTAKLEQQMRQTDWQLYFEDKGGLPASERQKAKEISDELRHLAADTPQGLQIYAQLEYKYWPENVWDEPAKMLQWLHEDQRSFAVSETGACNTNLAYHILSGNLDRLHEELSPLQLEQYPGVDVYRCLEQILSGNPGNFDLNFHSNEPEGYVEFQLSVHRREDGYHPGLTYTTTLTPYPPIEHGLFNGVDTRKLEDLMRQIDWHNDRELFIFHEDSEPEFRSKVGDVQELMYALSRDEKGAEVAGMLQLKYWADATFFEDRVTENAWQYFATLPQRQETLPVNMDAKAVFNLLCGRAFHPNAGQGAGLKNEWIRLDLSRKEQGHYPVKTIPGFGREALVNTIQAVPFQSGAFDAIRTLLLRGDVVPVKLKDQRTILLQANPEQQTIDLYTQEMRPIPVNLHFDPDWKPPLQQDISRQITPGQKQEPEEKGARQMKPGKPIRQGKRKGL